MNDIRNLILHLDGEPVSPSRLEVVKRFAAEHGAHIDVLYAVMPWLMLYPFAMDAGGYAAEQLTQLQTDARDAAKAAFERECQAAGLAGVAWRETQDDPVRGFRDAAWAADLMVLSQPDPRAAVAPRVPSDFVAAVLVASGKPGLVLPYVGVARGIGQRVLIAWKRTPEAARAVTAALPLLQRAGSVHVVSWDESGEVGADVAGGAVQFLQYHGVAASVHRGGRPTRDLGELLLSRAADLQADLLVMGCYGHGRAREWALGGVTRTVLQSMTLPVLMVH